MSMSNKRKTYDITMQSFTYGAAALALLILLSIVFYVFQNGVRLLSWDLIKNNYQAVTYIADLKEDYQIGPFQTNKRFEEGVYYSKIWGVALRDDENLIGGKSVFVTYVHPDSPLNGLDNKGVSTEDIYLSEDFQIIRFAFEGASSTLSIHGAKRMVESLDAQTHFRELEFQTTGGGIRGSIVTTLYLIVLTLLFALPIGVGSAL